VELGKQRGLIHDAAAPAQIQKDGKPAAKLLQKSGEILQSQWMDVTPAMAKKWLENNFRNRPIDDNVVAAYARDMTRGLWVTTHQGVAFNDLDELIDGQHRLRAIIRADKTIRMMVTFGLPSKIEGTEMTTMDAVDRGRTRSVADQLKIQHGLKDGSAIAQICSSIGSLCYGQRTRRLSVGQTLEVFRAFEHAVRHVISHRSLEPGLRQVGVLAGFAFALATEEDFTDGETYRAGGGTGVISAMFERLVDGENMRPGMPITRLREFLTSDEAKLLSRGTNRGCAELVLEAIALELKGKPVAKLELALNGLNHFRALQAERVAKIGAIFQLAQNE